MTRLRLVSPHPSAPAAPLDSALPELGPGTPVDIDQLFQLYASDVVARGLAMLGNPDEADDLVQDVFLRAFRALGALAEPRLARAWLMSIAVREALRRLKKRRLSRLWLPGADFDFERLADPAASPDVKLQVGRLFRALERLGPELRVAWVLRFLESETTEAVAEQCGWSLSTTKRRIAEAQQRLAKELGA